MSAKSESTVLQRFQPLRKELFDPLSEVEIEAVYHAFTFAYEYHEGQMRVSGDPYIIHPVGVATLLAQWRLDVESIQAGLLHDLIEDTVVDKAMIESLFGESVAALVDGVSKLTQIKFNTRQEAQAHNFRKMLMAMAKDIRVILVKLADRLDNMSSVHILSRERCRRISRETLEIYAPIAHRVGMHAVALELQDLGFAALYPDRARVIQAAVNRTQGSHLDILEDIRLRFQHQLKSKHIHVERITKRAKHIYSIYCKMRDKGLPFSKITDVYAIRIVTNSVDSCYRILGVIHSTYKPVPGRVKDYIALPKANGYQSLHTVLFGPYGVPIEVQIRTAHMDICANRGLAAHWQYKLGAQVDVSEQHTQQWIKDLMDMQHNTGNSIEFLENVKVDLFSDEIYVFTPKGDIIALPSGATAVDFAYAVHSDIGNHCVAVMINRQLSPLSTLLGNGYTVEVMTAPQAVPNKLWLDFVCTAKARSNIRHYFKKAQVDQSQQLGVRLLSGALERQGLSLDQVPESIQQELSKLCKVETFDQLLEDIALGRRVVKVVVGQIKQLMIQAEESELTLVDQKDQPLMISGSEGMVVQCASCCCPVPGDPISGRLISDEGIQIHHHRCAVLYSTQHHHEQEYVSVSWSETVQGEYPVKICIDTFNQRGVLATLALAVADADSSISDVSFEHLDGVNIYVVLDILVTGRTQLAQVIRRIRRLPKILKVRRGGQFIEREVK